MSPTVHRTTHHGIPVIWCEVDGPLTGTLMFGVGMRDEPPHLGGITHLAEHLIFRAMGDINVAHDGVTYGKTLEFSASGTPDEVADFLHQVVAVLSNPTFSDEDLRLERMVIEAENPHRFGPGAGLLTYRYGIEGIGKAHAGAPTLASISATEVGDWIAEWLVASNARLTFNGPLPPDLNVTLNDGPAPTHNDEKRLVLGNTLIPSDKSGVALSLLVDEPIATFLRDVLETELETELRGRRGLFYAATSEITGAVEPGIDQVDLVLDPLEHNVLETIERAVETIRRAAREGFSAHALTYARSVVIAGLSVPSAWSEYVDRLAITELVGGELETPDVFREQARNVEVDQLTAALRTSIGTLIVAFEDNDLPEGFSAKLGLTMDEFLPYEVVDAPRRGSGRRWRGRRFAVRDWARVDNTHLYQHRFGETTALPLDQIVVAGKFHEGALHLLDRRGRDLIIEPADWHNGATLVEEVLRHIPAEAHRDFSWHNSGAHGAE